MGTSPMGFYLRRGSDGSWIAAVAGRENLQPGQEYCAPHRPAPSRGEIGREPHWVRVMEIVRHGLDRANDRRA